LVGREVIHRLAAGALACVLAAVLAAAVGAGAQASQRRSASSAPRRLDGLHSPALSHVFAGVVPDIPTGQHVAGHVARTLLAHVSNVPYGGGEVLHSNRTHLIFWQPAGSGLVFDPGYEALMERFLAQVAADSRNPTVEYGLTGQYRDSAGPAAYVSVYAGAVVASDPLPANGCIEPPTGPGWTVCLSDAQLQSELLHVIGVDQLPTAGNDIYFLVTPDGLGDCQMSGPSDCALGGGATGSYCGYHSATAQGSILYAVVPYNAVLPHCQSSNPRPNGSTADPALSTLSHEQNETVTDPEGNAWIDGLGNEIADLCIQTYGPALGGTGAGIWDEDIDGGHYYLQELWSNAQASCEPRARPASISFIATRSQLRWRTVSFAARAQSPDAPIVSYTWSFGNDASARGRRVSHAFKRAGVYRVVLRTADSWGNWTYYARSITVTRR
jgi:hypothetical protein